MTAEIINFRKAQKARARTEKEKRAAENRAAFGRTTALRQNEVLEKSKLERDLDGKQVTPSTREDETK